MELRQEPASGSVSVRYAGDLLRVRLVSDAVDGTGAFLRTSYGNGSIARRELIAHEETGEHMLGRSWHDLPLIPCGNGVFEACLPLFEPCLFECKACLVTRDGARHWVPGDNARVKVEPATLSGDNTLYNAFVRQFGPNISGEADSQECRDAEHFLNEHGYTVVPPSGKFADVKERLPHIMDTLGFRILMFLPIHPAPTTFAKMGRFGSPFAPLDFFSVDPLFASFDRRTTPLEQFLSLCDAIHARDGLAVIDLPLDHTGWSSTIQVQHPEWFLRNPDGTFENPGAWGVIWADLCKLDFSDKRLWRELAEVLLHWCRHGVDGFRCDAGYMVPLPVWKYLTSRVREEYPDTLFLLEGLGGPWLTTQQLLLDGGLDWAYSESFQEFGFQREGEYLRKEMDAASSLGTLMRFAETHDNNRLAAAGRAWSAHRVAAAAVFASAGAYAVTNGVEWLATAAHDVPADA